MLLLLPCLGVTFIILAWALAHRQSDALTERYLRHAGVALAAAPAFKRGELPLPRSVANFLERSGVGWTSNRAIAIVAAAIAGGYLLGLKLGLPSLVPLLGSGLGLAGVSMYLRVKANQRKTKLAEQLPDMLMLMASALKGGLGFQQAIQTVAKEGMAPLSTVLDQLGQDLSIGLDMPEALDRFKLRMDSTDGEMFASALVVQRQTGGNLAEILLNLHSTIRDRQAVHGQVRALTAQGRLSGYILTAMPFFLAGAISCINHSYMMILFTDPRGRIALIACGAMIAAGAIVIRRIVDITF